MKISLRELNAGHTHFNGVVEEDVYQLNDPDVVPDGGYRYDVEAGSQEGSLWVVGRVGAGFQLRCVRCLECFPFSVELPDFAVQKEGGQAEIIDLTEEVREEILLSLPPHPTCDWAGGRVCPGHRLAAEHAPESASPSALRNIADSPGSSWDALNKLDIDDHR